MRRTVYAGLLTGSTVWCLAIIAAPLVGSRAIYDFFSLICHQDSARSWHIAAEPLAVCIRCASIYFAFAVSLWFGLRSSTRWLRVAVVVMAAEFLMGQLILDVAVLRAFSGILLGSAAAPFIRQGVEELSDSM